VNYLSNLLVDVRPCSRQPAILYSLVQDGGDERVMMSKKLIVLKLMIQFIMMYIIYGA